MERRSAMIVLLERGGKGGHPRACVSWIGRPLPSCHPRSGLAQWDGSRTAMLATEGYAARTATSPLAPFTFQRRDVGPQDLLIQILFCGICHSDIHQARDEWGGSIFPMVPGHEIVGSVAAVGPAVTGFRVGERVGVGCFVDSCRTCSQCRKGLEQCCEGHLTLTQQASETHDKGSRGAQRDE
jgi:alcohol dehydrogenase (NADP+)